MNTPRPLPHSRRWFQLLLRLYPADFRDQMGGALVATYMMRAQARLNEGGRMALATVWLSALMDSVRNGPGERAHPAVRWRRSGNWGRDMEHAWRRLIRAPLFVASIVCTLGVGLGAFGVVYTALHKVVLAPLPYDNADDLYFVWRNLPFVDLDRGWASGFDAAQMATAGGPIESVAALQYGRSTLTGRPGSPPAQIEVMATSARLFEMLGVQAMLGRTYTQAEEGDGAPLLVVLSHALWTQLGADRAVIGSTVRLDGQAYQVIGVMGDDFDFVGHTAPAGTYRADAYMALDHDVAQTNPGNGGYAALVRARAGSSPELVHAAVAAVGESIDSKHLNNIGLELYPVAAHEDMVAAIRPALMLLAVSAAFLVLVLTVNLATLLLTRAAQREQEFAISRALGANPLGLMGATLLEGVWLGLLGGIAATTLAVMGTRALVSLAPANLPRRDSIAVDPQIAALIIGVGIAVGFVAAIMPAVWSTRTQMATLLRNAAVRGGGGHTRMRRGLVVVQVALSLVLLTAGGLVVRSFGGLLRQDPGFRAEGVITFRVPAPDARYTDSLAVTALYDRIHTGLAAIPGVTSVGASNALPLQSDANSSMISMPGAPGNTGVDEADEPLIDFINTRAGYFDAMGISVIEGRVLDGRIRERLEVVIDRTLAQKFYPGRSALGARLVLGGDTGTVVGVVEHARIYNVHEDGFGQVYFSVPSAGEMIFALRTQRDVGSIAAEARRIIDGIDTELALDDVQTMRTIVDDSLRDQRLNATLIGAFSIGALLLAAMGLFGVVSAAVARRRHELAVRIALGADHGAVLRLILGEGALLVGFGLLAGLPGVFLASRALRGMLVGVSPHDPLTLAAVAAGLGAVALAACYLPARRVLRIQPGSSLREA